LCSKYQTVQQVIYVIVKGLEKMYSAKTKAREQKKMMELIED
jgi:hypothetical protein